MNNQYQYGSVCRVIHITSYHIISQHIISNHTISHHTTSHHITSNRSTIHHIISQHIKSHSISYHIISQHITYPNRLFDRDTQRFVTRVVQIAVQHEFALLPFADFFLNRFPGFCERIKRTCVDFLAFLGLNTSNVNKDKQVNKMNIEKSQIE